MWTPTDTEEHVFCSSWNRNFQTSQYRDNSVSLLLWKYSFYLVYVVYSLLLSENYQRNNTKVIFHFYLLPCRLKHSSSIWLFCLWFILFILSSYYWHRDSFIVAWFGSKLCHGYSRARPFLSSSSSWTSRPFSGPFIAFSVSSYNQRNTQFVFYPLIRR